MKSKPEEIEIVINRCFGGFGLSPLATKLAVEAGVPHKSYPYDRKDPLNAKDEKLLDLGGGWEVWGRPPMGRGLFCHVIKNKTVFWVTGNDIEMRSHPALVSIVRKMGDDANDACANLEIVRVPADAKVHIEEYDGSEHVAEDHRTW